MSVIGCCTSVKVALARRVVAMTVERLPVPATAFWVSAVHQAIPGVLFNE